MGRVTVRKPNYQECYIDDKPISGLLLFNNKIFHNDANLYNFMIKDKQLYIIDFGLAKEITPKLIKKLGTSRPNFKLMSIAMILKFKDLGIPIESYSYILNQMAYEDVKKFGLDK